MQGASRMHAWDSNFHLCASEAQMQASAWALCGRRKWLIGWLKFGLGSGSLGLYHLTLGTPTLTHLRLLPEQQMLQVRCAALHLVSLPPFI